VATAEVKWLARAIVRIQLLIGCQMQHQICSLGPDAESRSDIFDIRNVRAAPTQTAVACERFGLDYACVL